MGIGAGEQPENLSQIIIELLSETGPLIERVDELPKETAVELYDMYATLARTATESISKIDTELRVIICDNQDRILERVIDLVPAPLGGTRSVYTPAVNNYRRWSNVELMKDKGLLGYTLAKETGARPVMYFGTSIPEYPYLSDLPGMELLCHESESGNADAYYDHLSENHGDMDTLILHGMYEHTIEYLDAYRKLRPDGIVFCGLDMNSYWMAKIRWNSAESRRFAEQCDVIATSCRSLRDALNRSPLVHFPCRWFPNGFYNPAGVPVIADPNQKENVILTVGRIGVAVKNNSELLFAFARASEAMEGWKIRLVGPIEPEFQSYIDTYFTHRPDLRDRVIFTGAINDKAELYKEYARAKIFAFNSVSEGGSPNVYAEALFHGCMFVTSDIDAADDIINFGELGVKYRLGDADALSTALVKLCSGANKRAFISHIPKALAYAQKHYDWNRNAKKLAYMLYSG